jgi:vacuolar-type H+-ATPase subunit H
VSRRRRPAERPAGGERSADVGAREQARAERVLAGGLQGDSYHGAMEDHSVDPPQEPLDTEHEPFGLDELRGRPLSEISVASAKVAAIVEAAERAAEDLRLKTEERVRERIAEADRAADLRIEAAEAEARELVDAARREAAALQADAREAVRQIHERAAQVREEAERRKTEAVAEAEKDAARVRADAEGYADEVKRNAKNDARGIIQEAHDAAAGVLHDGTQLSGHLQELSDSLRRNAERLLNDVKLAHARLTADLDQAAPAGPTEPAPRASRGTRPKTDGAAPAPGPRGDGDFDVPEFVPGRR